MTNKSDRQDGDGLLREALADKIGKDIACTRTYSMSEWAIIESALRRPAPSPTRDGAEGAMADAVSASICSPAHGENANSVPPTSRATYTEIKQQYREMLAPPKPAPDAVRDDTWVLNTAAELSRVLVEKYSDEGTWCNTPAMEIVKAIDGFLFVRWTAPVPSPDGVFKCNCGPMCQDLGKAAGCRYLRPERAQLRFLVDAVYMHATEGQAFPSTDTADKLIDCAFPSPAVAAEPVTWPIETAPKNHTWVRLLVDYSGEQIAFPLFDSAEPSWTVGHNGEADTGEPGWTFMGWDWDQDCIVETNKGKVIGWLPFHASPTVRGDREIQFGYTNYRNENSYRKARPISIRYGTSEYHKRDGWLMLALDLDKNEQREFSMRDMVLVKPAYALPVQPATRAPEERDTEPKIG